MQEVFAVDTPTLLSEGAKIILEEDEELQKEKRQFYQKLTEEAIDDIINERVENVNCAMQMNRVISGSSAPSGAATNRYDTNAK